MAFLELVFLYLIYGPKKNNPGSAATSTARPVAGPGLQV